MRRLAIIRHPCRSAIAPRRSLSVSVSANSNASKDMDCDFDVLVNGGGVVALSFVSELMQNTRQTLRVGVLERLPMKPLRTDREARPEVRVYALSPRSQQLLTQTGAWKHVEPRAQPYAHMQVWDERSPGVIKFHARDVGAAALGHICEDATLQSALWRSLEEQNSAVALINDRSITNVAFPASTSEGRVRVELSSNADPKDKKDVTAKLLVGADGAMSTVRRLAGISTWGWGYGQDAVVATVRVPQQPQERVAWQKYLSTGPLAVLPLWDDMASIVWSVPALEAKRLKSLSEDEFLEALNKALSNNDALHKHTMLEKLFAGSSSGLMRGLREEVLGLAETVVAAATIRDPFAAPPAVEALLSPRLSFPLSFQQAQKYVLPNCALIGDAAHSIHPQAGQGLNLGLQDAHALSEVVSAAVATGQDFGAHHVLREYEQRRARNNVSMMSVVDVIHRSFDDKPLPPALQHAKRVARSLGMLGLHNLGPVKNHIAKFAMGVDSKQ